jgi:hypothetical protein
MRAASRSAPFHNSADALGPSLPLCAAARAEPSALRGRSGRALRSARPLGPSPPLGAAARAEGSGTIPFVNRSLAALLPILLGVGLLGAACGDDQRDRLSGAGDRARCMADGATATFGNGTAEAVRDAGRDLDALGDIARGKGSELREALDDCVDVEATLTDALMDAGLSEDKASCVAERALRDDDILGPLLVAMVFGDPGVGTAIAIAVRAGGPCLTSEDIDLLLPG